MSGALRAWVRQCHVLMRRLLQILWLSPLALLALQPAQAHLMVAQHGTLNFVGDGAYVVMSLPVSAFTGVDDDGDGHLSPHELRAHTRDIEAQAVRGLQLLGANGPLPLQGLMLSLSPDDHAVAGAKAHELVVLGRFALSPADTTAASRLRLRLTLFGKRAAQPQQQKITITRGGLKRVLHLAPGREEVGF